MRKLAIVILILSGLAGCSWLKAAPLPPPPRPLYDGRTATLDITNGMVVSAAVVLPPGFSPDPDAPPSWLAQGTVVGVTGTLERKTVMLGLSGNHLSDISVLASDFGPGAPDGQILMAAPNSDGMEIATAVAPTGAHRLDVMVVDTIGGGHGHAVASFDGDYRVTSLGWRDRSTIAIAIYPSTQTTRTAAPGSAAGGLYAVGISGIGSVTHLGQIRCGLGRLSFSPNRRFAMSAGDRDMPPAIIDLHAQGCAELHVPASPLRVLAWAPDSSALLYATRGADAGVFRYTVATGQRTLIAVASAAAAYASDGTIIALGNGLLSWKGVARNPDAPVEAEIALLNPLTAVVTINSLGFRTQPALFARSAMVLTPAADSAAIDTFVPESDGPRRELIDYSYPARSAFVLASGHARGPLTMSWSDDGSALAIVDGDAARAMLTVLLPPR